jgi:hypothetical protein
MGAHFPQFPWRTDRLGFWLSAVDSKPASDGRIKTSHFFRLNPAEMFWQGMI